jgi:Na+-transporting NADH:ubiquinone oxidoreductase subunit F
MRLSCQIKVKNDIELAIPEELFNVKEYDAEVVGLRNLTHDIKELRLKLLDPPEMDYKAGQFVQVEVPPYALTDEPVYRAYSVSSEPADKNVVELEIRLVPNGICTTYVHSHLKLGDRVTINGPHGEFGIHDGEGEMICIAGGSGMAPIKSILLHMLRTGNRRPVRYFFGARSARDLFLVDELRALEAKMPNFTFIPALSDPAPEDRWTGETGLITDVVGRHVASAVDKQGYLCGSPFMIDACVKVLTSKGMPISQIFYDKFA